MPRRPCCRKISCHPRHSCFKPAGVPLHSLEQVNLTLDELEALRLADLEGLHQVVAAERMGVSRPTFGRILETAHRKVAEALTGGKALLMHGGAVSGPFHCARCAGEWETPGPCPHCEHDTPDTPSAEGSPRGPISVRPDSSGSGDIP